MEENIGSAGESEDKGYRKGVAERESALKGQKHCSKVQLNAAKLHIYPQARVMVSV